MTRDVNEQCARCAGGCSTRNRNDDLAELRVDSEKHLGNSSRTDYYWYTCES